MNRIFSAAAEIQTFCQGRGWRFCFIGGLAVQRWGKPRLTQDVDLTILTGFGAEEAYVDGLLRTFAGRRTDTRKFALENRVVLLRTNDGVPLDVSLGAMPFEERAIERASEFPIAPTVRLMTCSAEDLVVLKVFASRPQDWLDIEGIVHRQRKKLNLLLVWQELNPLLELKEEPELAEHLRAILDRAKKES